MSMLIKTKGIVLHEMTIKDNDKRIILFSKEFGKMVVFANGAKKAKSPLLAGTQPFVFGEFFLYEGKSSYTLKQVNIDESFYELRQDMETLAYGQYFLEVIASVIQEMDANPELLRLLYVSLMALKHQIVPTAVLKSVFQFRSMNMLGFAPDLSGCMECGQAEGLFFLDTKGGIVCSNCVSKDKLISMDALLVLRYMQQAPLKTLYHFKLSDKLFDEIKKPIDHYFEHFVTGEYKSLDIINIL